MTLRIFQLPDLGEGLSEAELIEWLVSPGDSIRAGQAIARVETDKAQVDVTSPWAGRIESLRGEPGDRIQTGSAIAEIEIEGPTATGEDAVLAGPIESGMRVASEGEPPPADAGTVVGKLPIAPPAASTGIVRQASAVRAMPAARRRARELGIELEGVEGTGPGGVLTRADVEGAAGGVLGDPAAVTEPLRGVRLAMARNMTRSHASVVPATVMDDVDVDAWWSPEADVLVRLVRAIARACSHEPALNAWFDGDELVRTLHARVDLGLAIQTHEGLFAPVLRDVGNASATECRAAIDRLTEQTRARSLEPSSLRGATFTLSNFGSLGGRHAMLVIVPPQVGILGAGRIEPRVLARGGEVVVHAALPLSLSFDHRAVTGAEAANFLGAVRADLERAD
jgi:pyruvate dehydrogenase E2 component (dihydrolipoamide acetyltransferase)